MDYDLRSDIARCLTAPVETLRTHPKTAHLASDFLDQMRRQGSMNARYWLLGKMVSEIPDGKHVEA